DAFAAGKGDAVVVVGLAAVERERRAVRGAELCRQAFEDGGELAHARNLDEFTCPRGVHHTRGGGKSETIILRLWHRSYTFTPAMTLAELKSQVERGEIDTVLLAMTDMQGRLQGKRLTAQHFLDEVAGHGAEGCNYLLAVDVDMTPVDGYEIASWDKGYGDF